MAGELCFWGDSRYVSGNESGEVGTSAGSFSFRAINSEHQSGGSLNRILFRNPFGIDLPLTYRCLNIDLRTRFWGSSVVVWWPLFFVCVSCIEKGPRVSNRLSRDP